MHNGHVRVGDEKMAKSLGNFYTVRDVLAEHPAEVVRLFLLSSHYRSPLNYTFEALDEARGGLERLYNALRDLDIDSAAQPQDSAAWQGGHQERFRVAMDDDFNTREALAVLFDLAREVNRCRETGELRQAADKAAQLLELGNILGLLEQDPEHFMRGSLAPEEEAEIEELLEQRQQARRERNFAEADRIRDTLHERGIALEDTPQGTKWRKAD
jgi:cysteinyl-tRNA synthetase